MLYAGYHGPKEQWQAELEKSNRYALLMADPTKWIKDSARRSQAAKKAARRRKRGTR